VTGRYELVQRYYKLKKKLLGVDEMFDYDRYAPIAKNRETIKWDRAKSMVLEAYGDFHPRMKSIATEFFDKKWIDAAIRPGKRGGAYSASTVTNIHPYVFMNFDGQLRDVQTLAHELGHGVHQYLSRKQGELQSSTPLTTAETASVFGEMLVFNKLMNNIDDPKEKLALLVSKIDDTIATVFRQVSMNRFEDRIHTTRREEGELTTEDFSRHWVETQNDLYGDSITITDEYKLWWCYIPHFLHTPGYVYAYAFGELLVLALYDAYKNQKNGFSDRYIELLEAGGSDWPHNIVGKMDIDIRDSGFWNRGLDLFESMIDQAEELAESL
ncbi:MAG: M3 family oligoendopeptidase, partial [Balneolaceae bacterium]